MYEAFKYFGRRHRLPAGPQRSTGPIAFAGGNANNSGSYRRDYAGNNTAASQAATARPRNTAPTATRARQRRHQRLQQPDRRATAPRTSSSSSATATRAPAATPAAPTADTLFTNIGGNPPRPRVQIGGAEIHASLMDEFARHFFKTDVDATRTGDQKIHHLHHRRVPAARQQRARISNTDQQMINLMKSAANVGGGKYFAATQGQRHRQGAPHDPERGAGGEQRVRVGVAAGEREHAGHVPEPGVHGPVPPGRRGQPALARQREAVQVHPGLGDGRHLPRRLERQPRGEPGHGLHLAQRGELLDRGQHLLGRTIPRASRPPASDLPDGDVVREGRRGAKVQRTPT